MPKNPEYFDCTECEKKYKHGNYASCGVAADGRHRVPSKTYYSASDRLCISWKTDRTVIDPTGQGQAIRIPGADAKFIGGTYVSSDPEEQKVLDGKPYLQTEEQWLDSHTKPELKVARQKAVIGEQKALIDKLREDLAAKQQEPVAP